MERRLLGDWVAVARRHGLRPHQFVTWIRRKNGPNLAVWRQRVDGSLGCAAPCVLCQRELLRYDMRVHCSMPDDVWFRGRLDEEGAPCCKPTTGQMRLMFKQAAPQGGKRASKGKGGAGAEAAPAAEQQQGGKQQLSKEQLAKRKKEEQRLKQLRLEKMRREQREQRQAAAGASAGGEGSAGGARGGFGAAGMSTGDAAAAAAAAALSAAADRRRSKEGWKGKQKKRCR